MTPDCSGLERTFPAGYPSFDDSDGGSLLSMARFVLPRAVPATPVLAWQGRVNARILGVSSNDTTLQALITAAAEA